MTDIPSESSTQSASSENSKPEANYKFEILPEDYTNFDLSFKLIVIGDSGVGKSCLTNNAVKNILQIWDTCGQELYRSLITNFYRNSSLAIMVYAINSLESFSNIEMWLRELRTHSNPDAKVFLIGNKIDLEQERKVTKEQGEKFCKENNINEFMESSAKTGVNAQNIFIKAAQTLYEDYIKYQKKAEQSGGSVDNANMNYGQIQDNRKKIDNKPKKKQGGCC